MTVRERLRDVLRRAKPAPLPALDAETAVMKRDWDERARENAMHYIASGRDEWDEREFSDSGRESTEELVVPDLDLICRGRDPRELTVLEIGCGIGRMTEHLAALFGHVDGVDVSGEMIRRGQERLAHLPNVRLHETNGVDLRPFRDGRFDFAFSFIVFQHIPYRDAVVTYLRETHRVLKRGALFKFQVQGAVDEVYRQIEKTTWLGVSFSPEEMREIAEDVGFDVIKTTGAGTQYFWHWWRRR